MKPPFGTMHWLGNSRATIEILIVAPHPDDEAIGPGGRAILEKDRGVGALILTNGARGAGGRSEPGLVERRERESLEGLRVLGARLCCFAQLNSANLKERPAKDAARVIRWCVEQFTPKVVLTTSPFEHHPTHLAATVATIAALKGAPSPRPLLQVFPVWDAIVGLEGQFQIDISAAMDAKLRAVRCHQSQLETRPFDEAVRCRNRMEALLFQTTGRATAEFVETYLDLSELTTPDAPPLEAWTRARLERTLLASLRSLGH